MSKPNGVAVVTDKPVIKKPAPPEVRIKALISEQSVRARFEEMLGKRAPAFLSSIISAVSLNKQLAACDPMSVISSAAIAAAMDLPINASLGFAHIVPYNGVAQFQMGWKGFVQLAMRSGQYRTINATAVLEGQIKSHNQFTGEMEFTSESTSDKVIGYVLYFALLNGFEKYFYMSHPAVERHAKKYSMSYKKGFGVWVDDFEAMALKTVVKLGLSKYGILSVDMQRAVEVDQAVVNDDGEPNYIDAESREVSSQEPSRTEMLNQQDDAKSTAAVNPTVVALKSSDPGTFENFAGSLFAAEQPTPVETLVSVQIDVATLMKSLSYTGESFTKHVTEMFKKAPKDLTLDEVRKLRDRYQADLAKKDVK